MENQATTFIYVLIAIIVVYFITTRYIWCENEQENFDPSLVPVSSIVTLAKVAQKLVDGNGTLTNPGNLTVAGNLNANNGVIMGQIPAITPAPTGAINNLLFSPQIYCARPDFRCTFNSLRIYSTTFSTNNGYMDGFILDQNGNLTIPKSIITGDLTVPIIKALTTNNNTAATGDQNIIADRINFNTHNTIFTSTIWGPNPSSTNDSNNNDGNGFIWRYRNQGNYANIMALNTAGDLSTRGNITCGMVNSAFGFPAGGGWIKTNQMFQISNVVNDAKNIQMVCNPFNELFIRTGYETPATINCGDIRLDIGNNPTVTNERAPMISRAGTENMYLAAPGKQFYFYEGYGRWGTVDVNIAGTNSTLSIGSTKINEDQLKKLLGLLDGTTKIRIQANQNVGGAGVANSIWVGGNWSGYDGLTMVTGNGNYNPFGFYVV